MKEAAGYLRRSTDRQEQSIEDQRKAIHKYASENGFEVVRSYVDDAISGSTTEGRKDFLKMIDDVQKDDCPFRYVLVYDIKRFGRVDNDEAGYYRFLLRQHGIEVIYASENFSGDDTDDLLRPVKQWQARQESKDLSKVTIRGLLSLSEGGWWLGGVPPYGYDLQYCDSLGKPYMIVRFTETGDKEIYDTKGNLQRVLPRGEHFAASEKDKVRLAPSSPERVRLIRRIFSMYVSRGMGFKSIAETFNHEGIPSPRDGNWSSNTYCHWSTATIRSIIMNDLYTGDMVWNRRTYGKFHRIEAQQAKERSRHRANKFNVNNVEDRIVTPDAHKAIIDRPYPKRYFESTVPNSLSTTPGSEKR